MPVGIVHIDVHCIDMILARCRDFNVLSPESVHDLTVLALRVNDDNIRDLIRQKQVNDLLLCQNRLTRTGNTGNEAVAVEQFRTVDHNQVL